MEIEEIKRLVHDAAVLDYIMDQCGFIRMRVYESPHKWNKFKIKLYKTAFNWYSNNRHGSLMTYGVDNKPHVFVTSSFVFKKVKDQSIGFNTSWSMNNIQAKAALLNVLKESNGFKFQDEEHMRDKIDEMLVKADLEQTSEKIDEEHNIVSCLDNIINSKTLF